MQRPRYSRPCSDIITGLPLPPPSPRSTTSRPVQRTASARKVPIQEENGAGQQKSGSSSLWTSMSSGHRKKKLSSGPSASTSSSRSGGGYHHVPGSGEDSEGRLRSSRAECEQLRMKVKSTREECSRLQTQVMELSEVKEITRRLDGEVALLRSRTQSHTDEMAQRLLQLEEENKTMRDHVVSLETQMFDLQQPDSIGTRISNLERENELLCRESSDVREEYRRFVDEIGGQIVQSLMVQKALRDDYLHMRKRLHNVERQNRHFRELLQPRVSAPVPSSNESAQTPTSACVDSSLSPAPTDPLPSSWSFSNAEDRATPPPGPQMVTNGCYYKLEFSQPLPSPLRPPETDSPTPQCPPAPITPAEPPPSPVPVLGRSHVIMGSKTLPLLHQQQRNARQPRRNCPPPSRSFSKDDGYSSMTCDPTSPLSSRRELSTVGECPAQLEDDSTATTTASDNTTIVCAAPVSMETSSGTAHSSNNAEELETDPGPSGRRLAPSLDLETYAVLRRTTAAARRMAELCQRTGLGLRRSSSDSALLPCADRLAGSVGESSASGTASSSSSSEAASRRLRPSGGDPEPRPFSEVSLNLSCVDGLERRLSAETRPPSGVPVEAMVKSEKSAAGSTMDSIPQECLSMDAAAAQSAALLSSHSPSPPRAVSASRPVLHASPHRRPPPTTAAPPPVLIQRRRFAARPSRQSPAAPAARSRRSSSSSDSEPSPNGATPARRRSWTRSGAARRPTAAKEPGRRSATNRPPPIPPRTCSTAAKSPRVNLTHQTSLDEVRKKSCGRKRPAAVAKKKESREEEEEGLNPVVDLLSPSDFRLAPEGGEPGAEAAPEGHENFLRLCQRTTEEADERQIREKIGQLSATVSELQRHLIQLGVPATRPVVPMAHLLSTPPPERRGRSRSSSASGNAASDRDDLYIDDDLTEQPQILLGSGDYANEDRDSLLLELEQFQLPESSVNQD